MKQSMVMVLSVVLLASFAGPACSQEWTESTDLSEIPASVWAMEGVNGNNAWALLSKNGKIFHYDGTDWELQTTAFTVDTGGLRAIAAADSSHVWAVGYMIEPTEAGRIYNYDGAWHLQTSIPGTAMDLWNLYVVDTTTVYASADSGRIYATSNGGTTWTLETDMSDAWAIREIDGVDASHIWALATPDLNTTMIFYYDGVTWNVQTTIIMSDQRLEELSAAGPDEAWAAGDDGLVFHYSGGAWALNTDLD